MDKILNENLFLLEFLIDEVNLHPGAIPCELEYVVGETCVSIQFLDNDPLDICEADFNPKCCNMESSMKNGKSCLFAISPQQVEDVMKSFDLNIKIFKKLTYGVLPNKVEIGTAQIPMETLFNDILTVLKENRDAGTVSKTLKDIYPIVPLQLIDKCCIGDISVFIRMSCFGKLIITQFQMNLQEKSVFFKDKEGKCVYKYRRACNPDGQGPDCVDSCPGADACIEQPTCYTGCGSLPCNPPSCYSPPCDPPPCPPTPCKMPPCFLPPCSDPCFPPPCNDPCFPPPCNDPCFPPPCNEPCFPPPSCYPPPPCFPPPPCYPSPPCFPPPSCYPPPCSILPCFPPPCNPPPCSFPPCSPCAAKPCAPCGDTSTNDCTAMVPCCQQPPPPPPDNSCYQEIGAEMNGNALTIRVHKNKGFSVKRIDETGQEVPIITDSPCPCDQPKMQAISGCGCSAPSPPCYPDPCACMIPCQPSPCMHQMLSMKQPDDPGNPFTFKVSGCGTQAGRNVTIVPPSSTKPNDGSAPTAITDVNKDVFVLRIGKKSDGEEKKANLELELVTPKGKDKKPIPRKETRETQFVASDLPKKKPKKDKDSGKGKKRKSKKSGSKKSS